MNTHIKLPAVYSDFTITNATLAEAKEVQDLGRRQFIAGAIAGLCAAGLAAPMPSLFRVLVDTTTAANKEWRTFEIMEVPPPVSDDVQAWRDDVTRYLALQGLAGHWWEDWKKKDDTTYPTKFNVPSRIFGFPPPGAGTAIPKE